MVHKLIRVWKWWKSNSHLSQMHVTLSKKCLTINLTRILSTFHRVNQGVKQVFCVLYVSPRLVLSRKRLWNTFQVPLSDHNKCNVLTNSYWIASCSNSWLSSLTKKQGGLLFSTLWHTETFWHSWWLVRQLWTLFEVSETHYLNQ